MNSKYLQLQHRRQRDCRHLLGGGGDGELAAEAGQEVAEVKDGGEFVGTDYRSCRILASESLTSAAN